MEFHICVWEIEQHAYDKIHLPSSFQRNWILSDAPPAAPCHELHRSTAVILLISEVPGPSAIAFTDS